MGRNAASLAAKEKERGGLVILSAQYGPASAFSAKGVADDDAVIDVTIPLQALVQNSKLYIPGGRNKFNLMGFWVSPPRASTSAAEPVLSSERNRAVRRVEKRAEKRPRMRAVTATVHLRGSTDRRFTVAQAHRVGEGMIS